MVLKYPSLNRVKVQGATAAGYRARVAPLCGYVTREGMPLVAELNQPRFQDIFIKNTLEQVLDFWVEF